MSNTAIRIAKLGKRYQVGSRERYRTLYDALTKTIQTPLEWLRASGRGKTLEDHIWALKDVDLEVQKGEIVGIIGRNGAGKSTLLKILSRITDPTEGHAEIRGRIASLLEVGTGFHPELTGRENIYLNGTILGMRRAEINRKLGEIISFAEIEKFIDTPVKRYSSGMYVRLAFAVAAHLDPEILLVDEVLAVGDFEFQRKCLGKMESVAQGGRTVLFVSHNMSAIRGLCQRCVVFNQGQIMTSGETGKCIDEYISKMSFSNAAEVNMESIRRPEGQVGLGTDLRIIKVRLHSKSGQAVLQSEEPLAATLTFRCLKLCREVVLGFSIWTMDSTRLFSCLSNDSFPAMSFDKPGIYHTTLSLQPNPLGPGTYKIELGARGSNKGLDWIPEAMIFSVQDTRQYESLWLQARPGVVRVSSTWTMPVSVDDGF